MHCYFSMDSHIQSSGSKICNNKLHMLKFMLSLSAVVIPAFCLAISQSRHTALQFQNIFLSGFGNQQLINSILPFPREQVEEKMDLERLLRDAAMKDKTVILTNLNEAWIEDNSIFELFLSSFELGNQTALLRHLVVLCFDRKAFECCIQKKLHCYSLENEIKVDLSQEAMFMSGPYLEIVFKKIELLRNVLQLGYNLLFTDADIMWLRNPLPNLYSDTEFQLSSDYYRGDPSAANNDANTGFLYVKSTPRTIGFFELWYDSRKTYPELNDQDVFNVLKFGPAAGEIGLQIKYLDTAYFGGFCEPSRDLSLVRTMHANCCVGLGNKIHDLEILLQDWRRYLAIPASTKRIQAPPSWSPRRCKP